MGQHKYTIRDTSNQVIDNQRDISDSSLTLHVHNNEPRFLWVDSGVLRETVVGELEIVYEDTTDAFSLTLVLLNRAEAAVSIDRLSHSGDLRGGGVTWTPKTTNDLDLAILGPHAKDKEGVWSFDGSTPLKTFKIRVKRPA